jgi:thiamine biosynthesis lipoprotein
LKDLQDMRGRIGFDAVRFNRDRIVFLRPGMALTLNGIAQGFITDAIVAMLRADGITSSLVHMGENRAIGAKEDGSPWQVGLAEAELDTVPDTLIDLVDKAVATTAGTGFHFDQRGGLSHILDPQQETATPRYRRLTTIANTATLADAVSTGFSLMTEPSLRTVIAKTPDLAVDLIRLDGSHIRIER